MEGKKANLIGHMLRSNCLLKHVVGRKIEGRIERKGRRVRRRKQLLDDSKEKVEYCKLIDETLDRSVWRTRSGRDCGSVVRQDNRMTEYLRLRKLDCRYTMNILLCL
jgi:hypothetical protein